MYGEPLFSILFPNGEELERFSKGKAKFIQLFLEEPDNGILKQVINH